MFGWLRKLLGGERDVGAAAKPRGPQRDLAELARRLGLRVEELQKVPVRYQVYRIPKRSGGMRTICSPCTELKAIQKLILRRLLGRLPAHQCAMGFERGRSIRTNALVHVGQTVVIRMDIQDFFPSITAGRVEEYFRAIGWDEESTGLLVRLCTNDGSLPQGAPTSPRLSNLANIHLDARLMALARSFGAFYTRYADDITFSLGAGGGEATYRNPKTLEEVKGAVRPGTIVRAVKRILDDEGYRIHLHKKLRVSRRHQRQVVTGLVVNDVPNLPRTKRRWLRAVEHHVQTGRPATLNEKQLAGWYALRAMVEG